MALFTVYGTNRNSPSYLDNVAGQRIISAISQQLFECAGPIFFGAYDLFTGPHHQDAIGIFAPANFLDCRHPHDSAAADAGEFGGIETLLQSFECSADREFADVATQQCIVAIRHDVVNGIDWKK